MKNSNWLEPKTLFKHLIEEKSLFRHLENQLFQVLMNEGAGYRYDEEEEVTGEELAQSYRARIVSQLSGIGLLYEVLGLTSRTATLSNEIEAIRLKENGEFKIRWNPKWDDFQCEALERLERELTFIGAMLGVRDKNPPEEGELRLIAKSQLFDYLRRTGFYVSQLRAEEPKSESDVARTMRVLLEGRFGSDFHKTPQISQSIKNFVADCGLKSIGMAVEYKFITSKKELAVALEGIYADITGYSGSKDWHQFVSVFYMTDNFATADSIESEIRSKGKGHWSAIVISGKGARRTKTQKVI